MTDLFSPSPTALFCEPPDTATDPPQLRVGDVAIVTWAAVGDRGDVVVPLWQIHQVGWFQSDDHGRWMVLAHPVPYTAFPIGTYTFKPHDLHPIGLQFPVPSEGEIRALFGLEAPDPRAPRPHLVRPREAEVAKAIRAAGFNWDGWNRVNFNERLHDAMVVLFADTPKDQWPDWPLHHDPLAPVLAGEGDGPTRTPAKRPKKTLAELEEEASEFATNQPKLDNLF